VKKVWEELGLERIRQRMCQSRDAKEFVKEIVNLGEKDSMLVCCLLWNWWNWRNKINAKEKVGTWQQTVGQVRSWAGNSLQTYSKKDT
jgi:hypothetical protein